MVRLKRFYFAVRLGSVWPCPAVLHPFTDGRGEGVGAVAGPVVGHHRANTDPSVGEKRLRPAPERGGGFLALVGELFGVGQPGVVVDSVVEEHVATRGRCTGPGSPVGADMGLLVLL
jgi:hypothetical protein